jgi:hypothetical protein
MSTHCLIGVVHGETIKTVYCHFDGYPRGVGAMLLKYYDSVKANHLVSLGDISYLEKEIEPPEGVEHSFNAPAEAVTVFYGRDRGETGVGFHTFICEAELNLYKDQFEYCYLMRGGEWFLVPQGAKVSCARPLSEVLL